MLKSEKLQVMCNTYLCLLYAGWNFIKLKVMCLKGLVDLSLFAEFQKTTQ